MDSIIKFYSNTLCDFWRCHPALLYGSAFLLGCASGVEFWQIFWLPLVLLLLPLLISCEKENIIRSLLAVIVIFTGIIYSQDLRQLPKITASSDLDGIALLSIDSLTEKNTHFGSQWIYKGTIKKFTPNKSSQTNQTIHNIPFTLSLNNKEGYNRPLANKNWLVKGTLKQHQGHYYFSVKNDSPWYGKTNSFSLAEWRYHAKKYVQAYINANYQDPVIAHFLGGLVTGDFDDRQLMFQFNRFGVNHLLAISGFHFAIIATILALMLRLFFAWRTTAMVLIAALTAYFVFLGMSPSIMRAWIAVTIALTAIIIQRTGNGLNSLGIALLLIIIWNPAWMTHMGFQYSFCCTAAILLCYQTIDRCMESLVRTRALKTALQMDKVSQHAYICAIWFRQAMSLGLAVELTALPLTLFYFGKYPLIGFFYNLFFPFAVSIAMILLMIASLLQPFLPLGSYWIHTINYGLTEYLLDLTYYFPPTIDYKIYSTAISGPFLVGYLSILFCGAILLANYLKHKKASINNDAFSFL